MNKIRRGRRPATRAKFVRRDVPFYSIVGDGVLDVPFFFFLEYYSQLALCTMHFRYFIQFE